MEPVTLVLRSKRQKRAAAVQKLQHLVPAVILLGDGWSALTRHAAGVEFAIALFELVSGALFVFAATEVGCWPGVACPAAWVPPWPEGTR